MMNTKNRYYQTVCMCPPPNYPFTRSPFSIQVTKYKTNNMSTYVYTSVPLSLFKSIIIIWKAESKEKHGLWHPMPELTITRLTAPPESISKFQHIYHGQPYATVDFMPQPETLDLASVQYCNVWINRFIVGQCLHVLVVSCTHHYIHSQHMYRWKVFAMHTFTETHCMLHFITRA